jgi:ATP-dependent Zn protease
MTTSERDVATAYHEAGHAVMALALGRPVHRVTIEPDALRLGRCDLTKGSFRPSKDALETETLILLAGLAAEAMQTGEYRLEGAATDLRRVRSFAKSRAGGERQIERFERRMLSKTEHILGQPGVWLAVERIADELLRSITISGRAARHLFDLAEAQADKEG